MSRPPCTILTHFPQAPKRTPLLLLNSTLGDTLQYLAAFGYYPSFEVRHMLQRIHATKGPLLDALERVYGPRHLSTSTPRNLTFLPGRLPLPFWLVFPARLECLFYLDLSVCRLHLWPRFGCTGVRLPCHWVPASFPPSQLQGYSTTIRFCVVTIYDTFFAGPGDRGSACN